MTGMSVDVIRRAINAKRLVAHYPTSRPVILVGELRDWIAASPTESVAERRRRSRCGDMPGLLSLRCANSASLGSKHAKSAAPIAAG